MSVTFQAILQSNQAFGNPAGMLEGEMAGCGSAPSALTRIAHVIADLGTCCLSIYLYTHIKPGSFPLLLSG